MKSAQRKHLRNSAYFLIATGIVHTIVGLGIGMSLNMFNDLMQEGLFNSIRTEHDRNAFFWFLYSGFAMMLWGALFFQLKRVPSTFSWGLLCLSIIGVFMIPVSGIWLLIPQTIYMIWYQRKNDKI